MKTKYEVVWGLGDWETYNTREEAEEALKRAKKMTCKQWPPIYIRERKEK